jgi:cell division protein FtsN
MTKKIIFFATLSFIVLASIACKSKQQVAEISGAHIRAVKPAEDPVNPPKTATKPPARDTPTVIPRPPAEAAEVTRKETFKPIAADSEKAIETMKFKYHVVVGSFSIESNAKGLQTKLLAEGNKPIIVVNEQGMFRLLIASYNEYSEAREHINKINDRFSDAWVLVQKQ